MGVHRIRRRLGPKAPLVDRRRSRAVYSARGIALQMQDLADLERENAALRDELAQRPPREPEPCD